MHIFLCRGQVLVEEILHLAGKSLFLGLPGLILCLPLSWIGWPAVYGAAAFLPAGAARADLRHLVRWVFFNLYVGNNDSHAKNLSIYSVPGQGVTLTYPGNLSAQFLAYQDRSAGVYLAGMDAAGYPMSLGVAKQADGFRCWHEFTAVADEENARAGLWQSPYPIAIGVTQGRWCDTADQYKRWALQQKWCAQTLAERRDIPAWWKEGPDVHVCEVRTYDNTRTCTGSYYPKLHDHLRTFREKIDGPVVAMLAGWENHRRWTGGDYFPVFDAKSNGILSPRPKTDRRSSPVTLLVKSVKRPWSCIRSWCHPA